MYHNWLTVILILTSDLVSRICIESDAISDLMCKASWDDVVSHTIFRVTSTFTSDLVLRIIVSGAYLLYSLR